jgi:hypothetical protein
VQTSLEYYACPGNITDVGPSADLLSNLPSTIPGLCHLIQGVVLHPFEAHHYGVKIPRKRWQELELCEVASMLQRLWELERAPLDVQRSPEKRLLGNCRDYATLLCAFLRFQRIPARVRYGFASYFEENFYTDHVVCEYWNAQQHRWILVDAQIDEVLRHAYGISINMLDLPQDAFLLAGRAWQMYRSAMVEPTDFGITMSGPRGVAFIRTGVLHEVAALNKVELLCQDEWDLGEGEEQLQIADQLAYWTLHADTMLGQLRHVFEQGTSVPVPSMVRRYAQ